MDGQGGAGPGGHDIGGDGADPCKIGPSDRLKKGQPDPLGDEVDRILVGTDRFIIYSVIHSRPASKADQSEPKQSWLDWLVSRIWGGAWHRSDHVWLRTKYPEDYECAKKLRTSLGGIAADLAYICDMVDSICRSGSLDAGSSASLRTRATEMMARAMELSYEGSVDQAKVLLDHLRTNITTMRDSKNRMKYVQGNLFALIIILAIWGALRFADFMSAYVITGVATAMSVHALDILALGAIGAFFAVSASVSSIKVDHSVSLLEMVYTGFIRIPIGVIAAGVAIFLISGDWLLASIEDELKPWTYLLFGFLAGFSELFVPNALRQVEAATTVAAPSNGGAPG